MRQYRRGLWRVKSHGSRSGVRPQCDLMPKAPSKTPDFDWKGTVQTDYLGVPLMRFGEMHGTRRPRARFGQARRRPREDGAGGAGARGATTARRVDVLRARP